MAQPQNRAMLIQTGLSLLQPVGLGQSPIGHIANSFGQGVAAQQRNVATSTAEEDRQMEIARKKQEDVLAQKELGLRERQVASTEKNTNSMISERGKASKGLQSLYAREGLRDENNLQTQIWKAAMEASTNSFGEKSPADFINDPVWYAATRDAAQRVFGGGGEGSMPSSPVSADSPPTEEDIQFTMQKYGLTREQVLEKLK